MLFSEIVITIVAVFIIINALFWSLACHDSHCKIAKMVGLENCIPHHIHILSGIVLYIIGVLIIQRKSIF